MRNIQYLVIHTSASWQSWTAEMLKLYFLKTLKWKRPGYHVTVNHKGRVKRILPNRFPSNGVRPYRKNGVSISNANSVNICWIGGIEKNPKGKIIPVDNRTEIQSEMLWKVVRWYIKENPNIKVLGHNQIANKACPCFNVPEWLRERGVQQNNIFE